MYIVHLGVLLVYAMALHVQSYGITSDALI